MRLLRRVLRLIVAGAMTVAVGVTVNQVLNGGRWNLRWLAAAVALAVVAEALNRWLGTRDGDSTRYSTPGPVAWPNLADEDGKPLRLQEVTPRDLGVHPSRFGIEGNSPYVSRQADDLLADALTGDQKQLIIVEGPRLAGTTRTLAQAAQVHLPDHLAASFVDDPRVPLADMITQSGQWAYANSASGAVLWLDDLSPERFAELARVNLHDLPAGVRILATLDTGQLEGLRIAEQLEKLLDQHATRIRLTTITNQERRNLRAQEIYAPLHSVLDQHEDLFMGRIMVAWKPLRTALTSGDSEQATDRIALLRAVTDWYRVHMPSLLNTDVLNYLHRAYRNELTGTGPDNPISAAGLRDALQWAEATPTADRPRLIDMQIVPGGQRYAPYPLLTVIADDPTEDVSWPVANALWSYSDQYLRGDQRRDIGYSALKRGAYEMAARLLGHADTTIHPAAYFQLAVLSYQRSDWANSRRWLRRSIDMADPDVAPLAMVDLGNLEQEQGNADQARRWFLKAIDTSHPNATPIAMVDLGNLEQEQGNADQARRWFLKAIDTSHPNATPIAMVDLGNLEQEQGNADQARRWFLKAIGTNHPDTAPVATMNLGSLEEEMGNLDEARHWYLEAIGTNHPDQRPRAIVNLGGLEREQGDLKQARHWFLQAIGTNHPDAAPMATMNLGSLEKEQDNPDEARHWYLEAIGTGHSYQAPFAMYSLGGLEEELGNLDEARHWYKQTIDNGHPSHAPRAMTNLGILDLHQGDLEQAEHWFQEAIPTGHPEAAPKAMLGLGALKHQQGNFDEARSLWKDTIGTRRPETTSSAMLNLGILEQSQGNLTQARQYFSEAIRTGDSDTVSRAQRQLSFLDRHESERIRAEHFGRYGYLAYADPQFINRDEQHSDPSDTSHSN